MVNQQKPLRGFLLALLASAAWGALPIAVQQILDIVDAQTLVWYRFMTAAIGIFFILLFTKKLPQRTAFSPRVFGLFMVGIVGLSANFFLFSYGLNFILPTTSQVLWQLAPFTMMLCAVLFFREPFQFHQKIGLAMLLLGLGLFFNDRFDEIFQLGQYAFGLFIGASAAIVWVLYGIVQKLLLPVFSSQQILLYIYIGCAVVLTPFSVPSQVVALNGFALGCFIFCCLNTLIGYGAYAEALNHWDASKVSVITMLLPIFTMLFAALGHWLAPDTFNETKMNGISYLGTFIVVAGSIFSAVGHRWLGKSSSPK